MNLDRASGVKTALRFDVGGARFRDGQVRAKVGQSLAGSNAGHPSAIGCWVDAQDAGLCCPCRASFGFRSWFFG